MSKEEKTKLELAKIELEREKLQLEREKLKVENLKAIRTSWSIFIPLLLAAFTIAFNIWNQIQQSKSDFILQAAELVINAESPTAAQNKARALAALFPEQLPEDFNRFANTFDPKLYGGRNIEETKETIQEWIDEHPDQHQEILDAWILLYPKDTWIDELR